MLTATSTACSGCPSPGTALGGSRMGSMATSPTTGLSEEGLAAVIAAAAASPAPGPAANPGMGAGTVIEFGMHAFTVSVGVALWG